MDHPIPHLALLVSLAGCSLFGWTPTQGEELEIAGDENTPPTADGHREGDAIDGDSDNGDAQIEVCDGWDNDGDGLVDEETGGGACGDGGGVWQCVAGELECVHCVPAETREVPCDCGLGRIDRCSDDGQWLVGLCDGCPADPTDGCNAPGACVPGEQEYRRCDVCVDPSNCGATCVGALWRCDTQCHWYQVNDCATRPAECDRDVVRVESCGRCGYQRIVCDGCFWSREPCGHQGICYPNERRWVPCANEQCPDGRLAQVRCTATCEWGDPGSCLGCEPGVIEETIPCAAGYDCGTMLRRTTCTVGPVASCGEGELNMGNATVEVLQNDCTDNECFPGRVSSQACTPTGGGCGTESMTCDDTCMWGVLSGCVGGPLLCEPDSVTVQDISCGAARCDATYQRLTTCNADGCGTTVTLQGSCPECALGSTQSGACTTTDGQCGTRTRDCNDVCAWGDWSDCTAGANACPVGATEQRECSWECGLPGVETWQCPSGCGWYRVGACEPLDVDACVAGTIEPGPECEPGVPECGYHERQCDSTCHWLELPCPPCG